MIHILPLFDDDTHYQVNSFWHHQNLHDLQQVCLGCPKNFLWGDREYRDEGLNHIKQIWGRKCRDESLNCVNKINNVDVEKRIWTTLNKVVIFYVFFMVLTFCILVCFLINMNERDVCFPQQGMRPIGTTQKL